jgi:alpha-1,2-mannosyltransferase
MIDAPRSSSFERAAVALVCLALIGSCGGAAAAIVVARALGVATLIPAVAGTTVGAVATCVRTYRRLAERLPVELDGWFRRRSWLRWLWLLAAALAVANTARLGLFVAEPTQVWASALPPIPDITRHQCVAAYVRAGELAAEGRHNLWAPAEFAAPQNSASPPNTSRVRGLAEYLTDPYEYPPTFVVLPRAALVVTDDYQLIRAAWFGLSAVAFWLAFIALAIWMRGRAGATALLFTPVVALSFPVVLNLQFGQAHLVVVAASIAAMMQFARGRTLGGGVLLAFAITTKIFPGLLLVHLAVRRQWRAVAATAAVIAAMIAGTALLLGPSPLAAFVSEHLPRMASGEAFAFTEHIPDNHSLYGLAFKLAELGVDGADRGLASVLAWAWTAGALVLTVLGSRGRSEPAREAVLWLGILCLATLRSPFAPSYTAIGTLWLLAVTVGVMTPRWWVTIAIAWAWLLLQGNLPIFSPAGNAIASLPSQVASFTIAILAVWPRSSQRLRAAAGTPNAS